MTIGLHYYGSKVAFLITQHTDLDFEALSVSYQRESPLGHSLQDPLQGLLAGVADRYCYDHVAEAQFEPGVHESRRCERDVGEHPGMLLFVDSDATYQHRRADDQVVPLRLIGLEDLAQFRVTVHGPFSSVQSAGSTLR
jgi:hypothetical protein